MKKAFAKNNAGFSLVELIIVIAIMAILAGALAPALIKYIKKAQYRRYVDDAEALQLAIETTSIDVSEKQGAGITQVSWNASGTVQTFQIGGSAANAADQTKYFNEIMNVAGLSSNQIGMSTVYLDGDGKIMGSGGGSTKTSIKFRSGSKLKCEVIYYDNQGWKIDAWSDYEN